MIMNWYVVVWVQRREYADHDDTVMVQKVRAHSPRNAVEQVYERHETSGEDVYLDRVIRCGTADEPTIMEVGEM